MDNKEIFKTYLFISPKKLEIAVKKNYEIKIYHNDKNLVDKTTVEDNLNLLDEFLNENIFKIEKKFRFFVEDIYLIIEDKKFLTIEFSLKKENDNNILSQESLSYLLKDAKNQINENYEDRMIIHMIISNYLINDKSYKQLPKNLECDQYCLSLNFFCISKNYVKSLENIFKKYQIKIFQIISAKYLKDYFKDDQNDVFTHSEKILEGCNENEILLIPKITKNYYLTISFIL